MVILTIGNSPITLRLIRLGQLRNDLSQSFCLSVCLSIYLSVYRFYLDLSVSLFAAPSIVILHRSNFDTNTSVASSLQLVSLPFFPSRSLSFTLSFSFRQFFFLAISLSLSFLFLSTFPFPFPSTFLRFALKL